MKFLTYMDNNEGKCISISKPLQFGHMIFWFH